VAWRLRQPIRSQTLGSELIGLTCAVNLFADRSVEFFRTEPYRLWAEWNGAQWEVRFHSRADAKAEVGALTALARLLGSFLDHARAALNYTAYQVALLAVRDDPSLLESPKEGGKPFRPDAAEFPIYKWEKLYRTDNRLKRLRSRYTDPIRAVQPYHGGHQALWILHELAAQYRHWPARSFRRRLRVERLRGAASGVTRASSLVARPYGGGWRPAGVVFLAGPSRVRGALM
jgi:hypothetical protein